jgi:hypothetical protein
VEEILKYKWALIGTVVLHILLALSFSQMKFEGRFEPFELVEMPVLLEEPQQDEKKKDELNNELTEQGKVSNQTFNEADKMGQTNEAYDSRRYANLNEKVDEEVKNFEKQAFEDMKNSRESKYGVYDPTANTKKDENKNKKEKSEESYSTANSSASRTITTSRVSASYDLSGRRDEFFAKPSYICKGTGKVILKIKVNRNGKVISADVDLSVSNYTEECMIENAKKYALRCKFEAGTSFPDPQSGTITYTYVAQ